MRKGISKSLATLSPWSSRSGREEKSSQRERKYPPGFKLRHILRGHQGPVFGLAWSPDGQLLASGSEDKTIRLWDTATGQLLHTLTAHTGQVHSIAWSPDGQLLASGSSDDTIRLWDPVAGYLHHTIIARQEAVYSVAWSPDGHLLAAGSSDNTIRLWDPVAGYLHRTLKAHQASVYSVAWSPDGHLLASGSRDATIRLWDPATGDLLDKLKGHYGGARSITWSPDGHLLASSSEDTHIQLWSPKTGRKEADLEAHTDTVISVSFSSDGIFFGSKSHDGSVRLWRCDTWEVVAILAEPTSSFLPPNIAFHPKGHVLATLGEKDTVIRIWDLDDTILLGRESVEKSVHYTTAKIALVGDSGVGKTGLGWRLAHNQFKEHASTHGQQFWVINELGTKRTDGTECEAVLWDLVGQPDYRLVHSLFLDDVDLPLLLFDPTYREQPLSGVEFWLKQLSVGRNRSDHGILVGARTDRGVPTLTHEELNYFCEQNNISGGYIATSAKEGDGLVDLIQRIKAQIPWDDMPATITTQTFKRIKRICAVTEGRYETKQYLGQPKDTPPTPHKDRFDVGVQLSRDDDSGPAPR